MPIRADSPLVTLIREMATNERVSNEHIAQKASVRLGKVVSTDAVARLRRNLSLSRSDLRWRRQLRDVLRTDGHTFDPGTDAADDAVRPKRTVLTPAKHPALRKMSRHYRDLLYRWGATFETDVVVAARQGPTTVKLSLTELPFEPELLYACLWYASNMGVDVLVVPSSQ